MGVYVRDIFRCSRKREG